MSPSQTRASSFEADHKLAINGTPHLLRVTGEPSKEGLEACESIEAMLDGRWISKAHVDRRNLLPTSPHFGWLHGHVRGLCSSCSTDESTVSQRVSNRGLASVRVCVHSLLVCSLSTLPQRVTDDNQLQDPPSFLPGLGRARQAKTAARYGRFCPPRSLLPHDLPRPRRARRGETVSLLARRHPGLPHLVRSPVPVASFNS